MTEANVHPDHVFSRPTCHWGMVVAFLSMDATDPFWPLLGYEPVHMTMGEVRASLRGMIKQLRIDASQSLEESPPDIRNRLFVENVLRWRDEDLRALRRLGLHALAADHSEAPQRSGWAIALGAFPDSFPRTLKALSQAGAIPLGEALMARLGVPAIPVPDPLTPWDAQLCARHDWNPLDPVGFLPFDTLTSAARIHAAERALESFWAAAPAVVRYILLEEAQAVLDEYQVWMPERLHPPR